MLSAPAKRTLLSLSRSPTVGTDREREVRAHLEAVGVERLGDLHTNREFDRRRIGIFNRSAAGVVLIAVRVAERCADAGSNRLDSLTRLSKSLVQNLG